MSKLEYKIDEINFNITLPLEIKEVQISYIKKFGVNSYTDLNNIEIYRRGFKGRTNKDFRNKYISFLNNSVNNNQRLVYDDWNRFFEIPIEYINNEAFYSNT